eukprot:712560-Pleurochrysis_carterae.AAC.1
MAKHNALAKFTADLVQAADGAGAAWAVENPADCGDPGGAAWWPCFASHAPLWTFPAIQSALQRTRAELVTFAQCALGADTRKFTTVAVSPTVAPHAGRLRAAQCTHGVEGHRAVAHGRDAQGRPRAKAAAAYPPQMNA